MKSDFRLVNIVASFHVFVNNNYALVNKIVLL